MSRSTESMRHALAFAETIDGWVDARSAAARALWAKSGDGTCYLNLPQHLVDAACAAAAVWELWLSPATKNTVATELDLDCEDVRRLVIWWAGIHDIGKACKTFQTQLEKSPGFDYLMAALHSSGLPLDLDRHELGRKMPHGVVSGVVLQRWLVRQGFRSRMARRLSDVVDAHHGISSGREERTTVGIVLDGYEASWQAIHSELLDAMADTTGVSDALDVLRRRRVAPSAPVLQLLTGIVVMADWIASNTDAFPLNVHSSQVERLIAGMEATDLTLPWRPQQVEGDIDRYFQSAFDWPDNAHARPVQRAMAEAAATITHPSLVILEAETGVGKTEAALIAAQIIGKNTGAQGVYFATPTMATANGLLERTISWARRTADSDTVQSMYLAHSKSDLSEPFRRLKMQGIAEDERAKRASVVASSWMRGRRRGLLSNIVVGTMDQVIMMALQQRYSMLRHLALAGKVVIFDEVHAFDAYSSMYLERTLEWLSKYGVSVIMLSATLPEQRRAALVKAYSDCDLVESTTAYPLITVAGARIEVRTPEQSPTNLHAEIRVIDNGARELRSHVETLLREGGCALIICNTIARAQEAYRALSENAPWEIELHHSGFIARDRVRREETLRTKLGPQARRGEGRPENLVVVATQVAEQSLDIDADVVITDIAPVDLLIQRIGRLHRHPRPKEDRPEPVQQPIVCIRGITQQEPIPVFDSGAVAVYGQRLLLSTLLHLPEVFRRPDDVAPLVQAVYAPQQNVPEHWASLWHEAVGEDEAKADAARSRATHFRVPSPYMNRDLESLFGRFIEAVVHLGDEERGAAQVRDSEPTVEVIPIVEADYGYRAFGDTEEIIPNGDLGYAQAFRLASSTVRLPARITRFDKDFEAVVTELEERTPAHWALHYLLRGQLAMPLDDDGAIKLGRFQIRYSTDMGIECSN
ncbi:CRISPR-associated helicase Cas3' [Corynebacterium sp. TAE3-ERU2]|uniref:CRISPR-associated helicase Cas3' n=1 Tax=Corynebacterium sp. TAE3-ERU2 TaxID=2849497 RepID=UPI00351D4285